MSDWESDDSCLFTRVDIYILHVKSHILTWHDRVSLFISDLSLGLWHSLIYKKQDKEEKMVSGESFNTALWCVATYLQTHTHTECVMGSIPHWLSWIHSERDSSPDSHQTSPLDPPPPRSPPANQSSLSVTECSCHAVVMLPEGHRCRPPSERPAERRCPAGSHGSVDTFEADLWGRAKNLCAPEKNPKHVTHGAWVRHSCWIRRVINRNVNTCKEVQAPVIITELRASGKEIGNASRDWLHSCSAGRSLLNFYYYFK